MTSTPETIVAELLTLDPSLIPHRAEVEQAVAALLRSKPEISLREEFTRELLEKLQMQLHRRPLPSPSSPLSTMLPRFFFLGGGALVGALATFLILSAPKGIQLPPPSSSGLEEAAVTTPLSREAFGDLGARATIPARPQSGGGGGGGDMAMGQAMEADKMMILPPEEFTIVEYSYDGDVPLPEGDIEVLRRKKHAAASNAEDLFSSSPVANLLNLQGLGNLQVQQVSLSQPGKEPYSVSLDFLDGSIWINRITDYTSRPESICKDADEACFQQYRLKESDMLPMEELVSITRGFIAELGIDTSSYGEPQILDDWRTFYAQTEDKASYYFPEMQTVVLPLLIDGKPVFEEYGEPYGMNFSIDIRSRKVISVGNLRTHTFDSSAYAGIRDVEKLKKVMLQGGSAAWYPEGSKKVIASLEAPAEVYLHTYQWEEGSGVSSELFVPALSFDVTEMPKEGYSKKRVVVPLAAELVQRLLNTQAVIEFPMPLEDGPGMTEPTPVPAEEPKVTE